MRPLLVFDLGNVILDVDFERFARRVAMGSDRSEREVLETFCQGPLKSELDRGYIGSVGFAQEIRAWLGEGAPPCEEILGAWTDIFTLKEGAAGFLARCRLKYSTWLFSDTDPAHFTSVLNRFPVVSGFERYLVSFNRGMLKRDPGAFEVLSRLVARGRRVYFVDDLSVNIEAANAAGLDGILFESWESLAATFKGQGVW